MKEIYWLTRLDAINDVFVTLTILGVFGTIAAIICTIVGWNEDGPYFRYDVERKIGKYFSRIFIPLMVSGIIGCVFLPTTKEALIIYAAGGGLDYIKSDKTIQQLPKKVIEACDAYLDEILNDKNKE